MPKSSLNDLRARNWSNAAKRTTVRMGRGSCAISRPGTILNLLIDRVYHPSMDSQGKAEESNKINADKYWKHTAAFGD